MHDLLKERLNQAAAWSAIALGFAIPVSTAATNLLLFAFLFLFLISGSYPEKLCRIKSNPITLPVLFFVGACLIGSTYGPGNPTETLNSLFKYLLLLMAPLLAAQLDTQTVRLRALFMFCAAMLLTLFLSFLIHFHGMPESLLARFPDHIQASWSMDNPVVFKLHITHGFLMAVAAFILFNLSRETENPWLQRAGLFASLLAAINVLTMVKGRTGYLVIAVFVVYSFWKRFHNKGLFVGVLCTALLAISGYQTSSAFRERIDLTVSEATHWQPGQGQLTSIGQRFDYYTTSLAIIRDHPFLGVGIGGFKPAYREKIEGTRTPFSDNPHNQYLMIAVQLGLFGVLALTFLYLRYWQGTRALSPPFLHISQGILLAYLLSNLFNSFMLDFSERIFFVWITGVLFGGMAIRHSEGLSRQQ